MICEEVLGRLEGVKMGQMAMDKQLAADACDCIAMLLGMVDGLRERSAEDMATCQAALDTWGAELQVKKLFEELAELQEAVCKLGREGFDENKLAEEIADVEIMLEQMKLLFECAGQATDEKRLKLRRLQRRIEQVRRGEG